MNKHFKFYEDSWWDSVCDCCEATLMLVYNSDNVDGSLGSAHSEEECYQQALITAMGKDFISDNLEEAILWLDADSLLRITERLGIIVEIVEEE